MKKSRYSEEQVVEILREAAGGMTPHQTRTMQTRFRRRCAIEPVIGHLKSDYRLARNYLKGFAGDTRNLLLAAAAWNFNKWLNLAVSSYLNFLLRLLSFPQLPLLRLTPF